MDHLQGLLTISKGFSNRNDSTIPTCSELIQAFHRCVSIRKPLPDLQPPRAGLEEPENPRAELPGEGTDWSCLTLGAGLDPSWDFCPRVPQHHFGLDSPKSHGSLQSSGKVPVSLGGKGAHLGFSCGMQMSPIMREALSAPGPGMAQLLPPICPSRSSPEIRGALQR